MLKYNTKSGLPNETEISTLGSSTETSAEREGGQLLILPSTGEEAGALSSRTVDLSSDGIDNEFYPTHHTNGGKIFDKASPRSRLNYNTKTE